MMKKNIFAIALLCMLFSSIAMYGQEKKPRFSPEKYKAHMEKFIGEKAGFTTEEAQKFFPIYHKLRSEQRTINKEITQLKRRCKEEVKDENAYQKILDKIGELKIKSAQLDNEYYKLMYKAISAEKVFKALNAEDRFHRNMVRTFNRPNGPRKSK